ncbi:hypothetical protein RHS01_01378 [Rhizoctonia solani]|uniref:Uncharacterized protein n=1 Tax=Rhizoctonia solani TaxID=456999 RepID=A0A8H7M9B9_9AGAM|nr:hypothetical protein RHS01_01378 [Rhizoctonia solani]
MSPPMDVDPTHEDPQSASLSNVHQAKLQLNTRVMNAIQKRKANNPNKLFVSSRCFIGNDAATLLHILLEIHFGEDKIPMRISECHQYVLDNFELLDALSLAYTSKDYEELMDHPLMPFNQSQKLGTMKPSRIKHSLESAFEDLYVGNTAKLFIDTLNQERHLSTGYAAATKPYNWSISVVQSSGMGKSRMVEEAAKMVFTIPINIREKLPEGRITYPPPDKNIREFFLKRQSLSDKQQKVDYMIFFKFLFAKIHQVVQGQGRIVEVGIGRKRLYDSVIEDTEQASSQNFKINKGSLRDIETSMQKSCQALLELIQPDSSNQDNICLIYFDEAHSLTESVKTPDQEHERSQLFFIFLSTNSRLENFAPPPTSFPSDRVANGLRLIPSFTELPFDIYESTVLDDINIFIARKRVQDQSDGGIWPCSSNPNKNIFDLAVDKLTASGVNDRNSDALLAVLGVRIGIAFDTTNNATYSIQSRLVESHLRVVYWIPEHRGYMHTGAPSEPILAEAAARYLNALNSGRGGIAVLGPRRLSEEFEKGLLARESAGRLQADY